MANKVILILFVCVCAIQTSAQFADIQTFKAIYNLPQFQSSTLYQDSHGIIWIGNREGVTRFDGKSFQHMNIQNGLCSNLVSAFVEDYQGNLWIGTDSGISRLKLVEASRPGAFIDCYPLSEKGVVGPIKHLFISSDSLLWIGTSSKLFSFDTQRPNGLSESSPSTADLSHKEPFTLLWVAALLFVCLVLLLLRYSFLKFDLPGIHPTRPKIVPAVPTVKSSLIEERYFFIKKDRKQIRIASDKIKYIRGAGDYIEIYTEDNKLLVRYTMKGIMEKLPDAKAFMRVHRSWIVRLDQIKAVKDDALIIDETEIPLGTSYKAHFKSSFSSSS